MSDRRNSCGVPKHVDAEAFADPVDQLAAPAKADDDTGRESRLRLFKDGLWIASGHGVAAVAAVISVRLITELVAPALFGGFTLLNGILALLQGLLLAPMAQAALRFYPDFAATQSVRALRSHLVTVFSQRWRWSLIVFALAGGVDAVTLHVLSPTSWLLLAFALGLEAWKTTEIVMRNAAREQAGYAALYAADSIGRPAGAVLATWIHGASLESLLFGQSLGAALVLAGFSIFWPAAKGPLSSKPTERESDAGNLKRKMERFAAPLLFAPILGWVTGLADRYIIGGMLGLAQAGMYAAAYGLGSRPILMIGTVSEATLRQILYGAVADKNRNAVRRTLALWTTVNVLIAGFTAVLFAVFGDVVARLLLAEEYRATAVRLLPWIASGYVLLLAGQAMERLLYARHRIGTVMIIQATIAVVAIITAVVGALWGGLLGVAIAVPICFGVQLFLTLTAATRR